MKVLVTGATGFVGAAVVRRLLAAGMEVRVLIRPDSDLRNLGGLKVEQAHGDLRDRDSLRRALSGCRQLYHVAAHYALWAKTPSIFYEVNVTGTRVLLETARELGTERIVYTSTIGAIGLPADGGPGTEETPVSLAQMADRRQGARYKVAGAGPPPARPVESLDRRLSDPSASPDPAGRSADGQVQDALRSPQGAPRTGPAANPGRDRAGESSPLVPGP